MTDIEKQALAAYKAEDRDIPDSDLDDEQPLTLLVRTTLGEVRRIRRQEAMECQPYHQGMIDGYCNRALKRTT